MKSISLFFILALIGANNLSGQKNLTKEEILKYWVKSETPLNNDSLVDTRFDDVLDTRINKFIDSLKKKSVDSIIVYSSAYPGYEGNSKCKTDLFPIYTYVIWKDEGDTKIQKIEGNCNFKIVQLNSTGIFEFYEINSQRLKNEFFMPVILGAQLDKKQKVSYSMTSIDHEPNYCIYYSIGNIHRNLKFKESEIEDKRSLFIEHNLNLAAIKWWHVIKNNTTDLK